MTTQSDRNHDEDHLQALLREDFGDDAEQFFLVVQELRRLPELSIEDHETMAFAHQLRQQFKPKQAAHPFKAHMLYLLNLFRAEMQLMRAELWIASILVTVIGILLTETVNSTQQPFMTFVDIAPVMAALGVAFIFNLNSEPISEIILACVTSIRVILLARMTLIFCVNLLLGILGSVFLVVLNTQLSLWPLVAAWFAPMAFLSALAFFLAIISKEPLFGAAASMILWVWQHIELPLFLRLPIRFAELGQPTLVLFAALLFGVALWLAGKTEHWIGVTQ
jgi:hypothetical protein